jgi:adenylate kinase family enzyme
MRVVILGASGTGKTRLASALTQQLADSSCDIVAIPEAEALRAGSALLRASPSSPDLILLMGLDQATSPDETQRRMQVDARLREALQQSGSAYTVLYGDNERRAAQALRLTRRHAGQPASAPDSDAQAASRWVWVCDKCSDPVCEHRLFTDKLGRAGA